MQGRKRGKAREELVATATAVFNDVGYGGTDSNALARAAGYAPATFYRYFSDKLTLFLEIFRRSVQDEWAAIEAIAPTPPPGQLRALVRVLVEHHRRWAGLRRSMRGLVLSDATARAAFWERRAEQIDRAIGVLARVGVRLDRRRAAAAIVTLAALADAEADGELAHYGLSTADVEQVMLAVAGALARPGTEPPESK
jgi:AcrR family transcriptional regulator